MEIPEHIAFLEVEGREMAAAVEQVGPDAKVPTCPEWVVRDLVRHTGGVHRWATGFVRDGITSVVAEDLEQLVGGWPADTKLVAWFREGHAGLVEALRAAPADLECWTFLPAAGRVSAMRTLVRST